MPARRMRHRQTATNDLVGLDVDHDSAGPAIIAPSIGNVSLADCGGKRWLAVAKRQAVEVATVFGGKSRDKWRSPQRPEAMRRACGAQAGEQSIQKHDLAARIERDVVNLEIRSVVGKL